MDHNNAGDYLAVIAGRQCQCFIQQQGPERCFVETLEVLDTEDKHFVFHGQCLVLGETGVGKTSLVKSLTGKPFDSRQPKTQGIEQCLVDKTWKSQSMKDLVLGDLWKFFTIGLVTVFLVFSTGVNTNDVFIHQYFVFNTTSLMFAGFAFLICLLILFPLFISGTLLASIIGLMLYIYHAMFVTSFIIPSCTFFLDYNVRFRLVTLSVILRQRGLIIGFVLALLICYFNETYFQFASTRAFLLLAIVTGIMFAALFLFIGPIPLPFANNLGQLFTDRHLLMIFYFSRLPCSIFIGLLFGFAVAYLDNFSKPTFEDLLTSTRPNVCKMVNINATFLLLQILQFELLLEPSSMLRIALSVKNGSWGPYNVLLIVLVFYLLKLAWTWPTVCFVTVFLLSICYTLYKEWFCINLITLATSTFSNTVFRSSVRGCVEINNMLKNALKDKFTSLNLKIIDFAGDKEYIAYHHMFFRSQAVNIIVFNMNKFAENDFKAINAGTERLKFWFESVCSHVPAKTPILLVGTHRGNMDKNCMKILNEHLRRSLWNAYCDELVVNDGEDLIFFPVENSKGNKDTGVQALQKKIMDVAEGYKKSICCEIPLSWIRIQDAIISHTGKKEANFCVTLDRFSNVFDNFICNSWSKETLKYFHEKGLVIYLDKEQDLNLSNWVLLKPELLVDIIIQLINPPTENIQQRGLRCDWNLLQKKGILTKSLLRSFISKVQEDEEAMTAFLEEYDLICPLTNKKVERCNLSDEQPTHFVPSLLPVSAEGDTPIWHDNDTDKKCYVFFTRFLPEPLFHCLLSRAHKLSKLEFPNGQTVLFRDAGRFWMNARQPYSLKLMKEEKMIGVTFSCR